MLTTGRTVKSGLRRAFSVARTLRNAETPSPGSPAFGQHGAPALPESRGRRRPMIGTLALKQKRAPPALQDLDERVHALQEVTEVEKEDIPQPELHYTETDLSTFYQDVLANPFESEKELQVNEKAMRAAQAAEDSLLVQSMFERFDVDGASSTTGERSTDGQRPVQVILSRLDSIVTRLEDAQRISSSDSANEEQANFPVSIFTMRECEALVRVSAKGKDTRSAELTLQLMKRTGLPIPDAALTSVLQLYGRMGNRSAADRFVSTFIKGSPNEDQRHWHVQAHLKSTAPDLIPLGALDVLHSYENQNVPAPMETYTSVISALFHRPSSIARGQAWDLFSHMRYVAHPDPSVPLYTHMIKACAFPLKSSLTSEPEKALDLWTEMTVDHGLTPTVASYNAVILACARAGTKEFVGEAFRIARQMLDSHRDATGQSAYLPDRKTFCSLLEGAKRIGDLGRVRWILAEMTRNREGVESMNAPVDSEVDEEVMMHVFNAYAAYNPPFKRTKTVVLDKNSPVAKARKPAEAQTSILEADSESQGVGTGHTTANIVQQEDVKFAHIPPQTNNEVLQEVKFLFQAIRDCHSASSGKFRHVKITPRLVTAYLAVFYNHASLQESRDVFDKIFEEVGITPRPVRAYVEALDRCGHARKGAASGAERRIALEWAEALWKEWTPIEVNGLFPGTNKRIEARLLERINASMIRVYTLNEHVDRALEVVRTFAERYPPQSVRQALPKPALRSTKTILGVGPSPVGRPLVRMTGALEVPDDYVPPLLLFKDLELLHHKLVVYDRKKDISYLKWLAKAYEWALRVRRDESGRAVPPKAASHSASMVSGPEA